MTFIDLTGTIETGMWHYAPIPPVEIEPLTSIEADGTEAHGFRLATITGTYLETAAHHFHGQPTIDEIPPERFICEAVIVRLTEKQAATPITEDELQHAAADIAIREGEAMLLNTGWARMWNAPNYVDDSPYLTMDAMRWIVSHRISILGGDMPCFDNPRGGVGVNNVLFESGALILAPLVNLNAVPQGHVGVKLMAFPLKIKGVCGTPCRAIVEI
jgi:kynurenine formamidase